MSSLGGGVRGVGSGGCGQLFISIKSAWKNSGNAPPDPVSPREERRKENNKYRNNYEGIQCRHTRNI